MTSRASFNGCWHQKGHGLEGAGETGEGMTSSLAASVRCICKFDVCKCALGRYSSPCFGGPQRIPKCPIKVSLFIWQWRWRCRALIRPTCCWRNSLMSGAQFLKVLSRNIYQLCRYNMHALEVNKLRAANKKYIFGIRLFISFVLQLFICAEANAINKAHWIIYKYWSFFWLFFNFKCIFICCDLLKTLHVFQSNCRAVSKSTQFQVAYITIYIRVLCENVRKREPEI